MVDPVSDAEWNEAHGANALFGAYHEGFERGHWPLPDEAAKPAG